MIHAYPSISETEFAQACLDLETRCHDRLEGTEWSSVRWDGEQLLIKQNRHAGSARNVNQENSSGDDLALELAEMESEDLVVSP